MMRFDVEDPSCGRLAGVACFFLMSERGEPLDPVAFITARRAWSVGDTFSFGSTTETLRIVEIKTEIAAALVEAGFDGIWIVAPS